MFFLITLFVLYIYFCCCCFLNNAPFLRHNSGNLLMANICFSDRRLHDDALNWKGDSQPEHLKCLIMFYFYFFFHSQLLSFITLRVVRQFLFFSYVEILFCFKFCFSVLFSGTLKEESSRLKYPSLYDRLLSSPLSASPY